MKHLNHRLRGLLFLAPLAMGLGCASDPVVTVTSLKQNKTFREPFTKAFISRGADGDVDIVLIDEAAQQALDGGSSLPTVRQVMHIRTVWAATRDMKGMAPNAAVTWYVINGRHPGDMLRYTGIAFVGLSGDEITTQLKIRNAMLKPAAYDGALVDPLGESRMEGDFVAKEDRPTVEKLLGDLHVTTVVAEGR